MRKRLLLLLLALLFLPIAVKADTSSARVVISEVYGGGGNVDATYTRDFVELFNRTRDPIDLTGWRVQYGTAAGTTWTSATLRGPIAAYHYYLVALGSGGTAGVALPPADATGSMNLARSAGKVRLVNATGGVSDLIGYGTANAYETRPAQAASTNTESIARINAACTDTNNNAADLRLRTPPGPRNRSSNGFYCGSPPTMSSIGNKRVIAGETLSFSISAIDPDGDPLTFSASGLPPGATFSSRTFSWNPTASDVGTHAVTFRVSDGFASDSQTIEITVLPEGSSTITASVTRQAGQLVVIGRVTPSSEGGLVTVKLLRRELGEYRRVAVKDVTLNEQSDYYVTFRRPDPGHCAVNATFAGDADTSPSTTEVRFDC